MKPPTPFVPGSEVAGTSPPSVRESPGGRWATGSSCSAGSADSPARWWPRRCPWWRCPTPSTSARAAALIQSYCTMLLHPDPAHHGGPGRVGAGARRRRRHRTGRRRRGHGARRPGHRRRLHPGQARCRRGHGGRGDHRLRGRGPEGPGPRAVGGWGRRRRRPGRGTPRRAGAAGHPAPRAGTASSASRRGRSRRSPSTRCCSTTGPWWAWTGAGGRSRTPSATGRSSTS